MKHATAKIGEYEIPLIGISPTATEERCDLCKKTHHIKDVMIVMGAGLSCAITCKPCWETKLKGTGFAREEEGGGGS